MRVHHPAFGVPSPAPDEIRAACEPEARALWDAASSLASWRAPREEALCDAPYTGPPREVEAEIGPRDLVRAVVAWHPELLGPTLAGAPLDRASATWSARIGEPGSLPLAYAWGRRWAALRPPGAPIDVAALLRSLPDPALWALASLDPRAVDGLITIREAYGSLYDQLGPRGLVGGDVPPAWLERVPDQMWVERLGDGPGMVLLGDPGSGRRAALAQLRRLLPRNRGVNVDNWHGGGPPDPRYRARPADVPASVTPGLVCGWVRPADPELLRYAVEMALDPEARFQLILAASPAELADALREAPDLGRWPVVPVPSLRDDELLPIWLAQRPYVEDLLGVRLDLRRLLPVPPDRLRALLAAVNFYGRTIPEEGQAARLREVLGEVLRSKARASIFRLREVPELVALDAGFSGVEPPRFARPSPHERA